MTKIEIPQKNEVPPRLSGTRKKLLQDCLMIFLEHFPLAYPMILPSVVTSLKKKTFNICLFLDHHRPEYLHGTDSESDTRPFAAIGLCQLD